MDKRLALIVLNNDEVVKVNISNKKVIDFFVENKAAFSKDWNKFPSEVANDMINNRKIPLGDFSFIIFLNLFSLAGEKKRKDVFDFLVELSKQIAGENPKLFLF